MDSLMGKTDVMAEVRWKCQRAQITKLYFDHLLVKDVDQRVQQTVCANLRLFWIGLNIITFSEPKNFNNILLAIQRTYCKAGEALLEHTNQECIVCFEALEIPVALPCGHVGCKKCLEDHFGSSANRFCLNKNCHEEILESFKFEPTVDLEKAHNLFTTFKGKLNQFFIDLLQRFVYQQQEPPHQAITDKLLTFIVTKALPKDANKIPRTKALSPFPGDYIDPKPVVRSFILQLLFRYDKQMIKTNLQKFIDEKEPFFNDKAQFPELCILIVQCLEDSLMAKERKMSNLNRLKVSRAIHHMVSQLETNVTQSLFKSLWKTALDRLAINTVAEVINSYLSGEVEIDSISDLLNAAVHFVKHHAQVLNVQNYLIRVIASKHQVAAIMEWKKRGVFLDLMPEELRNATEHEVPDMFLLTGAKYREVRNALRVAWLCDSFEDLTACVHSCQNKVVWTLAFHHLTRVNHCKLKNPAAFGEFLDQHAWLANIWTDLCQTLIENLVGRTHRHDSVLSLVVHLKVCIIQEQVPDLLAIFKRFITDPVACVTLYLPTMPHDETVEAKKAVKDATLWYTCSQNHTYAIGDCGQPTQIGKCPTCKEPIGGENHAFVRPGQVRQANLYDTTKTGHVLGKALPGSRSTTIREIGGLEVAIIRFILHSSMLLGCQTHPGELLQTFTPPLTIQNPNEFLIEHLLLNLRQIAECLGESENEALVILHEIIQSLGKPCKVPADLLLNTKQSVSSWESIFVRTYIKPALKALENSVSKHQIAVQEDKKEAPNVLQEILFEKSQTTNDKSKILCLPKFWRPRENISIAGIETKLGAKRLKDHCPFLNRLIKDEITFQEITHLPKLLELSAFLVQNYGCQIEVHEASEQSIAKFISNMSDTDRKYIKPLVEIYLSMINKLKQKLFANNQ
jgi:hypothetical protein